MRFDFTNGKFNKNQIKEKFNKVLRHFNEESKKELDCFSTPFTIINSEGFLELVEGFAYFGSCVCLEKDKDLVYPLYINYLKEMIKIAELKGYKLAKYKEPEINYDIHTRGAIIILPYVAFKKINKNKTQKE